MVLFVFVLLLPLPEKTDPDNTLIRLMSELYSLCSSRCSMISGFTFKPLIRIKFTFV